LRTGREPYFPFKLKDAHMHEKRGGEKNKEPGSRIGCGASRKRSDLLTGRVLPFFLRHKRMQRIGQLRGGVIRDSSKPIEERGTKNYLGGKLSTIKTLIEYYMSQ